MLRNRHSFAPHSLAIPLLRSPGTCACCSPLQRTGKARVNPALASIFARLHIDAERWQSTLQSLLRPGKLIGQYFRRLQNLREMAARHGKRWVKNHGTRAAPR